MVEVKDNQLWTFVDLDGNPIKPPLLPGKLPNPGTM
jgi:hypothetical protein